MGLVVVNLMGPMSVETWTGMCYALVVVKVSSWFKVGQPLRLKSKASTALQEIIAMLERQSGLKLKQICSDVGT